MSGGGPPHQPHNRHVPPTWNPLQVPSFFPRQPQLAHMQVDPSILHQSSWHTPTTEAMKLMPHSHVLSEMLKNDALFPRDCVDLSLTRNGNQNGELSTTPISLSVRDTNKINSLSSSGLDMQAMELKCMSHGLKSTGNSGNMRSTSMSPGLKSVSPGLKNSSPSIKAISPGRKSVSPGPKSASPSLNPNITGLPASVPATVSISDIGKNQKRSNVRVDSILERLNPTTEKVMPYQESKHDQSSTTMACVAEKLHVDRQSLQGQSVIVQAAGSYDENSNSSGTNLPTATNPKEDDSGSMNSNEDSLDSTKSRRKRKPSKTIRVNKEEDIKPDIDKIALEVIPTEQQNHQERQVKSVPVMPPCDPAAIATILEDNKIPERRRSSDDLDSILPAKTRRKTSSESETIDDIAAMVQEGLKEKEKKNDLSTEIKKEDRDSHIEIPSVVTEKNSTERDRPEKLHAPEVSCESIQEKDDTVKEAVASAVHIEENDSLHKEQSSTLPAEIKELKEEIDTEIPPKNEVFNEQSAPKIEEMVNDLSEQLHKPVTVSVIKSKENLEDSLCSPDEIKHESSSTDLTSSLNQPETLQESVEKKPTNTSFVDVENKLEEMFAGIVENHTDVSLPTTILEPPKEDTTLDLNDDSLLKLDDSVTSTSQDIIPNQNVSTIEDLKVPALEIKKDEKKSCIKKAEKTRTISGGDFEEDGAPSPKRKRFTKTKGSASSGKKISRSPAIPASKAAKKSTAVISNRTPVKTPTSDIKDVYAYDSGSNTSSSRSRGPFVQIRGHRDSPLSVSVVNTPLTGDEDGDRKPSKTKKYHDDSEYRHKVRSKGLHCSTLSTKYDAERKDTTWICAFCKRGPHSSEFTGPSIVSAVPAPGDLFGPYFITTQCPEFERRLDDPYDRQFKSRKISKALDETANIGKSASKKAKRKSESLADQLDSCLGITQTTADTYEVWAHEDCLVWSAGVYLIGPKIAGLEEAVWTCSNVSCAVCGYKGANVPCLRRGCLNSTHLCCARGTHWQLDDATFKAYCPTHAR
ncbi:uncharacterized protein LOC143206786 isoform X2 [Rhynchophorus ferrugineus]|uniref:uncharacterized protein LOC143206786 isoform X2 n=1 Tax=Rhynchophorus ferrugineus TaxID=354439 RepID=UPI003FCE3E55